MNKNQVHILVVEDDSELAQWISDYLSAKDFRVTITGRGDEAVTLIQQQNPDVVILDGMLPGLDGLDVCKTVRPEFDNPIIMLTARDEEIDEVLGLEMGADDYLTKPVRARVLLTRIRKLLERQTKTAVAPKASDAMPENLDRLQFSNLIVDRQARVVSLDDERIKISSNEFDVLWLLAQNAGQIVSRNELVKQLRGFDYDGFDRSIDLRIS
ncbi:MAG: response regulator, partial [Psychrosphaera sp.]|nr:response regulator [Psychrosphaera sp.]